MGGHVFGSVIKIRKNNINITLDKFKEEMTNIFPKAGKYFNEFITLGSVGKKDWSGDIDLAFDERILYNLSDWGIDPRYYEDLYKLYKKRARTATDKQCQRRAILQSIVDIINTDPSITENIEASGKGAGNGMISIAFPQYVSNDTKLSSYVQIDLMFGAIDWLKFSYYSDVYIGNIKGLHRTQFLVHLFTYKGYSFSHNQGVKKDNEVICNTPEECINLLNKIYNININRDICSNYIKLHDYLKENLSKKDLEGVYDIYLKTLDSTRCDIPDDLQEYWINNQSRLNLKGKFLPEDSKLFPYKIDETIENISK